SAEARPDRQRHHQAGRHRVRVQMPRHAREARLETTTVDNPSRTRVAAAIALLVSLAPSLALAVGPQLSVQQIELTQKHWPRGRAYVNLLGNTGAPIPGLSMDLFRVYEDGKTTSSKLLKLDTLDNASVGASIVIVVQASGAMALIKDDIKKAVSAFINGLAEKDQIAVVSYSENADVVSPFTADKGEAAGKANKIE